MKTSLFIIMRICFFSLMVFSSVQVFAQTKDQGRFIDSLNRVIRENRNDTSVAETYLLLAQVIGQENPDSSIGLYKKSILFIEKAVSSAKNKKTKYALEKLLADALNNLGVAYLGRGNITQTLENYYKCLAIKERINDQNGIAVSFNNIGFIDHYYLDDIPAALKNYQHAKEIFHKTGDKKGEALLIHNIAGLYKNQGDTIKAIDFYKQSLIIRQEVHDYQGISDALNNLSVIYREQKKLDKALDFAEKSIAIRSKLQNNSSMGYAFWNLAEIYLLKGEISRAESLAQKAIEIGKKFNYIDIIKISSLTLKKIFTKQNKWKDALEMGELHTQMADSTRNLENKKSAIKQKIKYEYEKKAFADSLKFQTIQQERDLKIKNQQVIIGKERLLRNAIIAISLLVIVLLYIAYRNFQIKSKSEQLKKANEIRQRISLDLHDEIGAELTTITMLCRQVKEHSIQREKVDPVLLNRIQSQTENINVKLSEVVWATNPENDNLSSMLSYMRHYVSQLFDSEAINGSIDCQLQLPDEVADIILKPDVSRNLFFVLKETLNNIVKHSGASKVRISFNNSNANSYSLIIEDNGKGFDTYTVPLHRSGLGNMRKRIEEIGGKFFITTMPGNGTKIEISGILT